MGKGELVLEVDFSVARGKGKDMVVEDLVDKSKNIRPTFRPTGRSHE